MFEMGEGKPKPAAPEMSKDPLKGKLLELLNVGESATWPELEEAYGRAKDALENNPGKQLSPDEEAALHRIAQAARENARAAELGQAT
ncbi:MAG: hypothetical protein Q7S95_00010 [bacterium]|nr:hypothetical protein [bacterium]